jgi:light-regulated signal transduction histidine kinase (bacteriophytochrome)
MSNYILKEIQNKSKEIHATVKENTKHAKREKGKLETSHFILEKIKLRYQKSFQDWKESDRNYQLADQDGTISRNEILKRKLFSEAKLKQYEDFAVEYHERLDKTNDEQREYFDSTLPEVMNSLQEVDRERVDFVRKVLHKCLAGEREMVNIINKCREGIEEAIATISFEKDQEIVVQR